MIYLFGIIGFVLGFGVGLFAAAKLLRHYAREELLKNKSLRWTYGLGVWLMGAAGAFVGVWIYETSFL